MADAYGNGKIRLTPAQNLIIHNVPDSAVDALRAEPLLREFRSDPSEVVRGLVSCTGNDYRHFALIDTEGLAFKTARILEQRLGPTDPFTMHWSGCPNACGNHTMADNGLLSKRTRIDGEMVDAVDIFLAFFGWFGIAPLMALVRDDLELTKPQIGNTIIASVAITIVARLIIGWLCDRGALAWPIQPCWSLATSL